MDLDNLETPTTIAALRERNQRAYEALEDLLRGLNDEQLARPGPDGWAIKDHLAHLATWQNGVTALLQRRSRPDAMGVRAAWDAQRPEDEINDLIYRANVGSSSAELREMLRDAHRQMDTQLESMRDEDLQLPYRHFTPAEEADTLAPVVGWIVGNAYRHYEEHIDWIRSRLQPPAAP